MTNKKIAPEPPRRHCSMRNTRTLSQDSGQITAAVGHNSNLYYSGSGIGAMVGTAAGNSSLQQQHVAGNTYLNHHLHHHNTGHGLHHQQQQQQQQQPIYANYATIQQTTAEIHCEKFHDNKVTGKI